MKPRSKYKRWFNFNTFDQCYFHQLLIYSHKTRARATTRLRWPKRVNNSNSKMYHLLTLLMNVSIIYWCRIVARQSFSRCPTFFFWLTRKDFWGVLRESWFTLSLIWNKKHVASQTDWNHEKVILNQKYIILGYSSSARIQLKSFQKPGHSKTLQVR